MFHFIQQTDVLRHILIHIQELLKYITFILCFTILQKCELLYYITVIWLFFIFIFITSRINFPDESLVQMIYLQLMCNYRAWILDSLVLHIRPDLIGQLVLSLQTY